MRAFFALFLIGSVGACLAQEKPAPPAEVDQALRDRASKFLQAHVDGKYRQADQYVAEDSKDTYFAAQKPRYFGFNISKIDYSENFTKAVVLAECDLELSGPLGKFRLKVPQQSYWKVESGLWFWYVDTSVVRTPFGTFARQAPAPGAQSAPQAPPAAAKPSVGDLWKQVTADRSEVRFPHKPSTEYVTIRNEMPGVVSVSMAPAKVPGLEAELESAQIPAKGAVRVKLSYTPRAGGPAEASVFVSVEPISQTIPIRLVFAPK